MSGVEVALAIVPICLSALNGISILRAKFHILQHHHGEVERVRKRFKAQVGIFQDELLRVFVDSCEARGAVGRGRAEFMILGDDAWNALEWKEKEAELQKCVEEYLGERFSRFCGCIKEVETITREMYEKLRVFADPNKRAKWSQTARDAFRIAFRKQGYNEEIDILKELINEMGKVRGMAEYMNTRKPRPPPPSYDTAIDSHAPQTESRTESDRSSGTLLRRYKDSGKLLADFLALLSNNWSCNDTSHTYHTAQVLLRCVESRDEQARLAFLLGSWSQQGRIPYRWVNSQAILRRLDKNQTNFMDRRVVPLQISGQHQTLSPSGLVSPPASSSSDQFIARRCAECDGPDAKRQRIQPPETIEEEPVPSYTNTPESSLCSLLTQPPAFFSYSDLGFSTDSHLAFATGGQNLEPITAGKETALSDLLDQPVYDVVSDRHRITVALTLAKAMLKFHTTRAWPSGCLMSRVKLYRDADDTECDLAACLSTLHIPADVGPESGDIDMDTPHSISQQEIQDAREIYGIQNMSLYCLGVALLQIGLWEAVEWNDVVQVRRKTARLSYLGEKYHTITKGLVHCTLGSGLSDLASDELQEAVIQKVVFGLEDLLSLMKQAEPSRWP